MLTHTNKRHINNRQHEVKKVFYFDDKTHEIILLEQTLTFKYE